MSKRTINDVVKDFSDLLMQYGARDPKVKVVSSGQGFGFTYLDEQTRKAADIARDAGALKPLVEEAGKIYLESRGSLVD